MAVKQLYILVLITILVASVAVVASLQVKLLLFIQNGIETTVAAHETLLRNRKNVWVQLAGHPGECWSLMFLTCHFLDPEGSQSTTTVVVVVVTLFEKCLGLC